MRRDTSINALYVEIGKNVKAARTKSGLTQEDLAVAIGRTRVSVTNMEAGKQWAPLYVLYEIAAATSVQITDILPPTWKVARNKPDVPSPGTHLTVSKLASELAHYTAHPDRPVVILLPGRGFKVLHCKPSVGTIDTDLGISMGVFVLGLLEREDG